MPPAASQIGHQLFWLFVLAIPIATVSRTVVFEEVFREAREWCQGQSQRCRSFLARKFFYLFTCEYCFSHWVTLFFLILTRFRLLLDDWRGYIISFFATVWLANAYMSLYSRLRVDIHHEKAVVKVREKQAEKLEAEAEAVRGNGS